MIKPHTDTNLLQRFIGIPKHLTDFFLNQLGFFNQLHDFLYQDGSLFIQQLITFDRKFQPSLGLDQIRLGRCYFNGHDTTYASLGKYLSMFSGLSRSSSVNGNNASSFQPRSRL